MLKIGITGGIGSGKTTVAKIFACLGIPIFNADEASKMLLATNKTIQTKVAELLGEAAFTKGIPNKNYIANIIFNNPQTLAALNAIMHPAVIAYGQSWIAQQKAPYIIREAAILFESNTNKNLDAVIGVYAPQMLRIARTMQRNNLTLKEVTLRINQQMNEDEKMKLCNYIIYNNEEQALLPQILTLHTAFKTGKLTMPFTKL